MSLRLRENLSRIKIGRREVKKIIIVAIFGVIGCDRGFKGWGIPPKKANGHSIGIFLNIFSKVKKNIGTFPTLATHQGKPPIVLYFFSCFPKKHG